MLNIENIDVGVIFDLVCLLIEVYLIVLMMDVFGLSISKIWFIEESFDWMFEVYIGEV